MKKEMNPVSNFLAKKGSLDLLLRLDERPMRFGEVQQALNLSPNTTLDRLREALRLGLIEEKVFREDGAEIKYVLSGNGRKVLQASKSIENDYLKLREKIIQLEKEKLEKEKQIETLLSSLQKSQAIISISRSIIRSKGKIEIKAETKSENKMRKS